MTRTPIVRLNEIDLKIQSHGDAFEAAFGTITGAMKTKHLGARLVVVPPGKVVVPPGKKAWPHHCHHANDELFVVLEGEGSLRFGEDRHPLNAGCVAVCPTGGLETAHQIINSGTSDLKYIAVSSMREPDIMEYPDSGKWGAFAGSAPGGKAEERTFSRFIRADAEVEYWDGEDA
ncbi:MAG: cupin domain-containing protein [Proteobacteria bacterium]|nr:cupin domain-containing protein [Pseudomonadota bacterium]